MVIYKITNKLNGLIYIGQTIGQAESRWRDHLRSDKRGNSYLHRALKALGAENFAFSIIDKADSLEHLNDLEEYYIQFFNSIAPNGYNLLPGGNNRRCHELTKAKLSETLKGTPIPNRWNTGNTNPCTEETKLKIAAKLKGRPIKNRQNGARKGRPVSETHRAAISATMTGVAQPWKYKPVVAVETGIVYESVNAAAKAIGVDRVTISGLIKSGKRGRLGLSFRLVKKEAA